MARIDDGILWAFVSDELAEEEAASIRTVLERDPEVRERVAEMRRTVRGVQSWSRLEQKARVAQVLRRSKPIESSRGLGILGWAAASVLLLISVGLFFTESSDISNDQLFANHFEALPLPGVQRSADQYNFEDSLLVLYGEGGYEELLKYSEDRSWDDLSSAGIMSIGVSALAQGYNHRAEEAFINVLERNDPLYTDHAEWYLLLLDLADNRPVDIPALRKMAGIKGHDHQDDAQALLHTIE